MKFLQRLADYCPSNSQIDFDDDEKVAQMELSCADIIEWVLGESFASVLGWDSIFWVFAQKYVAFNFIYSLFKRFHRPGHFFVNQKISFSFEERLSGVSFTHRSAAHSKLAFSFRMKASFMVIFLSYFMLACYILILSDLVSPFNLIFLFFFCFAWSCLAEPRNIVVFFMIIAGAACLLLEFLAASHFGSRV